MSLFKGIRVALLSMILLGVAFYTYQERQQSRSWDDPLEITIYPINADHSHQTYDYISGLKKRHFSSIDEFVAREAEKYGVERLDVGDASNLAGLEDYELDEALPLVMTKVGPTLHSAPPPRPDTVGRVVLANIIWSLKLRYWAFVNTPRRSTPYVNIRMYVIYHPLETTDALPHSSGLEKGLLGVVHAYADKSQTAQNNVVIAHEFLHMLGATDKYGADGVPLFPQGYGDITQRPLYPQRKAEIMGGRRAITQRKAEIPESLALCVIGQETATEIGWREEEKPTSTNAE